MAEIEGRRNVSDKPFDGGPAFPGEQGHDSSAGWNQTWDPGISVRDYFAVHAPPMPDQWWEDAKGDGVHYAEAQAAWAVFYADALLKKLYLKDKGEGHG